MSFGHLAFEYKKDLLSKHERLTLALYEILKDIAEAHSLNELIQLVKQHVDTILNGTTEIFIASDKELDISTSSLLQSDLKEKNMVLWVFENGEEAGWSTTTLPESINLCIPLKDPDKVYGVLTYRPKDPIRFYILKKKIFCIQ